MIVDRIFESADSDGDGVIAGDEINSLDERMRSGMSDYDSNSDGKLERAEVLQGFQRRMSRGGFGRGGGRGRGGP